MHWEFQAPVIGSTPSGVICSPEDLRALFDDLLEEELVPMIMQLRAACAVVEDKLVRSKSVRNSSWRHLRIARLGSANALCGQAWRLFSQMKNLKLAVQPNRRGRKLAANSSSKAGKAPLLDELPSWATRGL